VNVVTHLSSRLLSRSSFLLGNPSGLGSLGGGRLLWSSLSTCVGGRTLLGCSGGGLGDGREDSWARVACM
jgi:hypothetical protein